MGWEARGMGLVGWLEKTFQGSVLSFYRVSPGVELRSAGLVIHAFTC